MRPLENGIRITYRDKGSPRSPTAIAPPSCDGKEKDKKMEPADKPGSVWDDHSSGAPVTGHLARPTRRRLRAADCPKACLPIWSCSRGGLPCRLRDRRRGALLPSPFHPYLSATESLPSAVCFLLHFPSAHAAQVLPGLSPCGARTFLRRFAATAIVWPTPPRTLGQAARAGKRFTRDSSPARADTARSSCRR